jgi:hypothetical protein
MFPAFKAAHDALDVAIDDCDGFVMGDAGDGCGRVRADAGKGAKFSGGDGEVALARNWAALWTMRARR